MGRVTHGAAFLAAVICLASALAAHAQNPSIISFRNGRLTWSNSLGHAGYRVEWAPSLADETNIWRVDWDEQSYIELFSNGMASVLVPFFYRVVATSPLAGTSTVSLVSQASQSYLVVSSNVEAEADGSLVLSDECRGCGYLWVPHLFGRAEDGALRGTVAKVDARTGREVARYLSFRGMNAGATYGDCRDINGVPLTTSQNRPARVAVTVEGDCWVVNETSGNGHQPSVTRIAGEPARGVDWNGAPGIQTSRDVNGDGVINVNDPDEFLGLGDECILFTVAYGESDDMGRSVAVDASGNAWVASYRTGSNSLYRVTPSGYGPTEAIDDLPMPVFNMVIDDDDVLWATDIMGGRLYYYGTKTGQPGSIITSSLGNRHYGICVDEQGFLFLGGWDTKALYRYAPDRTSFDSLDEGKWCRANFPVDHGSTLGVCADARGAIWVAHSYGPAGGAITRTSSSALPAASVSETITLVEGVNYWPTAVPQGDSTIGVAVDLCGRVWSVTYDVNLLHGFETDYSGRAGSLVTAAPTGANPFVPTDFSGYAAQYRKTVTGLFSCVVGPDLGDGRYLWRRVLWDAAAPPGTSVALHVRVGESAAQLSDVGSLPRYGPWTASPADLESLLPENSSAFLVLEFLMDSDSVARPAIANIRVEWDRTH